MGKDSSGKTVEPFAYKGTTYLPVRAVGEALNKKVDWDGKTQTVIIDNDRRLSVEEAKKMILKGSTEYAIRHDGTWDVEVDGVVYYLFDSYRLDGKNAANAMFVSSKDGSRHSTSKFSHLWEY